MLCHAKKRKTISGPQTTRSTRVLMPQLQPMPLFLNETAGAHFNLSDARARRWLLDAAFLPAALREVLQEHDENRRVESTDGGLLLVISDFTYEDDSDPSEAHLPGANSFWLVLLVILASGGITLALLFWRRLL